MTLKKHEGCLKPLRNPAMEIPSLLPSDCGVVQELGTAVSLNILGEDFDSGNIRLDPKSNTQKKDVVYYGLL